MVEATVTATPTPLELGEIQGLVAAGYGHLHAACFVVLRIDDSVPGRPVAVRDWLGRLAEEVTTASGRQYSRAVNVALTYHGLLAVGLPERAARTFPTEFVGGMTVPHRARAMGDRGESAPERWAWGGPSTPPVDVLLMLYAGDRTALEALYRVHAQRLTSGGLVELKRLDTVEVGAVEQFNFADGISQPTIEGLSSRASGPDTIKAGEFILGYPNEYGRYTDSPVVTDSVDPTHILRASRGGPGRDLGRNGTYLVFRELAQDIAGFWAFLHEATCRPDGSADRDAMTRLSAKIVGRWPGGAPLVLAPDGDNPALAQANEFGYHHEDPAGDRCPLGAHIRRANPRDSLPPKPGTQASLDVGKRHRIIRRGRRWSQPEPTGAGRPASPDGLYFIGINANIARQFEFIQGTWLNNPKFNGLSEEPDPLVGTQRARTFRIPGTPVRTRVTGLPAFVRVEAGAYFFLPSVSAIRFLAAVS